MKKLRIQPNSKKISERMTEEMKLKMLEQEEIAKKIIEESKVQARW